MSETKRETEHKPQDDHGEEVTPHRVVCDVAGWLYDPKDQPQYTGRNQPWRE